MSAASVIRERNTEVVVAASVTAEGGYLNVIDTYDQDWRVEVDRQPATLLRANGLYRAVRLAPGSHEVRFTYRPVRFYAGLVLTLATALMLAVACLRRPEGLRLPVAGSLQVSGPAARVDSPGPRP